MDPLVPEASSESRFGRMLVLVTTAALAAALLRLAFREPVISSVVAFAVLVLFARKWLERRRLKQLLLSGDVMRILERWSKALSRVPYSETMAPVLQATAFAAYGWIARARDTLAKAERGPAWEAALEHRLFLDTLLLAFEGDRDEALRQAHKLERLPLPHAGPIVRGRIQNLRGAAAALARAFAHKSQSGDRELLERASEASPLVYWAMRYASAVLAIDSGDTALARNLVKNAPPWPEESVFRNFHVEIEQQIGDSRLRLTD